MGTVKRFAAIAALITATTLVSGCGNGGVPWKSGPPVISRLLSRRPGATVGTPPPGVGAKAWSADVSWTSYAFAPLGLSQYLGQQATAGQLDQTHVKYGLVATIGDVV